MRALAQRLLTLLVAAGAVGAGFGIGWVARGGSPGVTSGAETLAIAAAGTLAPILPGLAQQFAAQTPNVVASLSADLFEGSRAAAQAVAEAGEPFDVFFAADFVTIPSVLEPASAGFEIVFASDPLVLAYGPTVTSLTPENWPQEILRPGLVLGVPNASVDPLGANVIFALELEDRAQGGSGDLFAHFFSNVSGFAHPTAAARYVPENDAASALAAGTVGLYITYRSYAVVEHLSYVPLPPFVDLGGTNASALAADATVSTRVLSPNGGSHVVHGAPVLFSLTVPLRAPSFALGVAFGAFFLSNATRSLLGQDGFVPLLPLWADHPSAVPLALAGGGIAALPAALDLVGGSAA